MNNNNKPDENSITRGWATKTTLSSQLPAIKPLSRYIFSVCAEQSRVKLLDLTVPFFCLCRTKEKGFLRL